MATPLTLETLEEIETKNAVLLVAFPTTGSAASIAAQYLGQALTLPLVGHLPVPELAGVMAIQAGLATSAIRLYGGEVVCKLGKKCPRVYVLTTELTLPPPQALRISEAILAWAKKGGVHVVIALEAVIRADLDSTPDVYCASAQPAVLKELSKTGTAAMERALIGGIGANLVLTGQLRGVRTGALIVEAARSHPDGRAAAALIEAVARFLPDVPIDPKPLMTEATKLEQQIRSTLAAAERSVPQPDQASFI